MLVAGGGDRHYRSGRGRGEARIPVRACRHRLLRRALPGSEWEAQQQLLWPSSWKLAALATCHGIICEDRVGYVSARDCTVVQAESES